MESLLAGITPPQTAPLGYLGVSTSTASLRVFQPSPVSPDSYGNIADARQNRPDPLYDAPKTVFAKLRLRPYAPVGRGSPRHSARISQLENMVAG